MKISISAVLLCLIALPDLAGAANIPPEARAACRADAKTHCNGVMPGGGRIVACFVENASSLSANCSTELAKISCTADAPAKLKAAFPCKG